MECEICHRSDPDRLFYCSGCLAARLADHQHQRLKLLDALKAQARRAEQLLRPAQGALGAPGQDTRLGVEEERLKKAVKWTLAVKVRDTRLLKDELSAKGEEVRASLVSRRAALEKRKANLSHARAVLASLAPANPLDPALDQPATQPPPPAAPPAPPAALSSLSAAHAALLARHDSLSRELLHTRTILTRELLAIYGFGPVAPSPSASTLSPFVNPHSDSDTEAPDKSNLPISPTYSIAGLPLPPLSKLVSFPPAVLSASLSHLLHLTRLLALYTQQEALPFAPFPSLYGQGLPGLRAAPGWPTVASHSDAPPSSASPSRSSSSTKPRAYPLFVSRKHATGSTSQPSSTILDAAGDDADEQAGGFGLARSGEGDGSSRARGREKWARAVRKGVVALAYDLAWLAWRQGHAFEGTLAELEDVGGLVLKAAAPPKARDTSKDGAPVTPPGGGAVDGARAPADGTAAAATGPRAEFAFDFDALVGEFLAELEAAGGGGVESVVLVAKPGTGGGEAEDDEWDLVEAGV